MAGNLKTKQNLGSYNNAIRELNKTDRGYEESVRYKLRVIVARELNLLTLEARTIGYLNQLRTIVNSMGGR